MIPTFLVVNGSAVNWFLHLLFGLYLGPVSGLFVHVIKDRLYCDAASSPRRMSCLATLGGVLETLTACLAPVLPHLAEEVYRHHPVHKEKFWFRVRPWAPPSSWACSEAVDVMTRALSVKAQIDRLAAASNTANLSCELRLDDADAASLLVSIPTYENAT